MLTSDWFTLVTWPFLGARGAREYSLCYGLGLPGLVNTDTVFNLYTEHFSA